MFNTTFFKHVQLLRDKYYTDFQFNLFSVLRNDSDEVRLHSRFLAEILNPKGSHGFDAQFLAGFLELIGIEGKLPDQSNASVLTEYKNIDILIRSGSTAIIIENKIYARDQDNQLTRYYESIQAEGIEDVYLVYLTLKGEQPSGQSTRALDKAFLRSDKFQCLSYKNDIHRWINSCLSLAARNPALRESFAQYLELIEILTAKIRSVQYMEELKKLLLKDDNFSNFLDLQQAHNSVLLDLQVDLWGRIQIAVEPLLGKPDGGSITSEEEKYTAIQNFMDGRRGSKYFGLFYSLKDGSFGIGIEMDDAGIIAGIYCSREENAEQHDELVSLLDNHNRGGRNDWWPCYQYIEPCIHYKNLTSDDLSTLSSKEKRQEIAEKVVDYISAILDVIGEPRCITPDQGLHR